MPQISYDPAAGILAKARTGNTVRADAWDAFHDSADENDLEQRLRGLALPDDVKADLWDLKASGRANLKPAATEDFLPPKGQRMEGSSFADKIRNAAAYLGDSAKFAGNEVVGAMKGAAHTGLDAVSAVAGSRMLPGLTPESLPPEALDRARAATAYSNLGQQVGGGLETAAEIAMPVAKGIEAIPSAARAGERFQSVARVANQVPIDVSAPGDVALRIADLAQRGGGTNWGPPPVRQFIQYVTDPKKPPMTYEVARDFASNISRLSTKDLASIPPAMMREIAGLRVTLNKSVAEAAQTAGKGTEYVKAMTEYAKAKQLQGAIEDALAGAKKALPYAGAGAVFGGSHWLTKHIAGLWGGE
jgi:hypothetical protein